MAVLTVWTIALLFAAGFTSQASVSSSKMIQEKNSKYTTGAGAIAAAMESIPAEAVELTKAEAQKAQSYILEQLHAMLVIILISSL